MFAHGQAVAVAEVDGNGHRCIGKVMVNVQVTMIQSETQAAYTYGDHDFGHFALPTLRSGPYFST